MKSFKQHLSEKINTSSSTMDVPTWIKGQKDWDSHARTQIYESTVCIVAIKGKDPKIEDIKAAMKNAEFNPIAKGFYERFFQEHDGQKEAYDALKLWVQDVGGKAAELGKMKSFIHKRIDDYYTEAPETFEVPEATKNNTADAILIEDGSPGTLFSALKSLVTLSKTEQKKRIKMGGWKKSRVSITDGKGTVLISFYQCSLKNDGQVGKSGAYLNKNLIGGTETTKKGTEQIRSVASPEKALSSLKAVVKRGKDRGFTFGEEVLYERMLEEGKLIDFAKGKLSKVVSSLKNFAAWAANKLSKLASKVVGKGQAIANKLLRRNKGLKAIEDIFSQIGQPITEEYFSEAIDAPVKLTSGMIDGFKVVEKEFLKSGLINNVHKSNVKLMNDMNSKKMAGRVMDPVVMLPNENAAIVDTKIWARTISTLTSISYDKKSKTFHPGKYKWPKGPPGYVTREDLDPMFKIAMNFSANVAIFGILKGMLDEIETTQTVTSAALHTLSGQLEGEVRFGNTALPLIIIYGGKHQEIKAMGKRDDYVKDQKKELTAKSGNVGDFPVLVFRYNKQGDKAPKYNTVNMRLLSKYEPNEPDGFKPIWLEFGIRTNTGSGFSCTIEASNPTPDWKGRGAA